MLFSYLYFAHCTLCIIVLFCNIIYIITQNIKSYEEIVQNYVKEQKCKKEKKKAKYVFHKDKVTFYQISSIIQM